MKLYEKPTIELLYKFTRVNIPIERGNERELIDCIKVWGDLDLSKDYRITIEPIKKQKTNDQVRYFWELLGQLAKKLGKPNSEIYQNLIRDNGVKTIVPIKAEAIPRWEQVWSENGSKSSGWFCEDLGECRNTKGYHNLACYYGISIYKTDELSRVIDELVQECKEQGIQTETPEELERLKSLWKGG